jgi:gamma-glutamylputrescine oxidase
MGTGQRAWPEEQEADFGFERARRCSTWRSEAKMHLLRLFRNPRYRRRLPPGPDLGRHKKRYVKDYREHVPSIMTEEYGYPHMQFHRARATSRAGRLDALSTAAYATRAPATSIR